MSNGGELFALREDIPSQPNFEQTLRGYDKRQVDRYVARADAEIATLVAEREQAFAQLQELTAQVTQLQAELEELRRQPAKLDRASFHHLGPMVEQILGLAEQQAEAITTGAAQKVAADRAEAQRVLAEAQEQAAKAMHDFEVALAARRAEEEKADEQRRAAMRAEMAKAQEELAKLRAEQEATKRRIEQETKRVAEATAPGWRPRRCARRLAPSCSVRWRRPAGRHSRS